MTGRICFHCDDLACPGCAPSHWLPRWIAGVVLALVLLGIAVCTAGCGAVEQHELDKQQEARLADLERDNAELERLLVLLAEAVARAEINIKRALERLK